MDTEDGCRAPDSSIKALKRNDGSQVSCLSCPFPESGLLTFLSLKQEQLQRAFLHLFLSPFKNYFNGREAVTFPLAQNILEKSF